jgi:hypothetical protein
MRVGQVLLADAGDDLVMVDLKLDEVITLENDLEHDLTACSPPDHLTMLWVEVVRELHDGAFVKHSNHFPTA